MVERFDQVLDECITRVLNGESVESCLARHPAQAAELEPALRTVVAMAQSARSEVSTAAKQRGRQALRAEIAALNRELPVARSPLVRWLRWPAAPPFKWAVAALVIVAVVFGGGAGTVAASTDAIPGQPLYPVKRIAEQARLGLQFSTEGKASLQVAYAERRAQEAGILAEQGDDSALLQTTVQHLEQSLTRAGELAAKVENQQALGALKARLQANSDQALASLQETVQSAPSGSRPDAAQAFQSVSAAYGGAVEAVALKTREQTVAASFGIIQVRLIDPASPELDQLLVEFLSFEAYRVEGKEGRWIALSGAPQTVDLRRLTDLQRYLGEWQVPSGAYSRLRFQVGSAQVVTAGKEHAATVPSDRITLRRPFTVDSGRTTVLVLDFDADESVRVTRQEKYVLDPVVRIFADTPAVLAAASKADEKPAPKQGAKSEEKSKPKTVRVEIEGLVSEVANDHVVVDNKRIGIGPDSPLPAGVVTGRNARVEAQVRTDGAFVATRVEVGKDEKGPAANQNEGARNAKQDQQQESQPSTAQQGDRTRPAEASAPSDQRPVQAPAIQAAISGKVRDLGKDLWKVDGDTFFVGPETKVDGKLAQGSSVKVEGTRRADGVIVATTVKVIAEGPDRAGQKSGEGERRERLTGIITALTPGGIRIGDRTIVLSGRAKVEGTLVVGANVEVEGTLAPDGTLQAVTVEVVSVPSAPPVPAQPVVPAPPSAGVTPDGDPTAPPVTPVPVPVPPMEQGLPVPALPPVPAR